MWNVQSPCIGLKTRYSSQQFKDTRRIHLARPNPGQTFAVPAAPNGQVPIVQPTVQEADPSFADQNNVQSQHQSFNQQQPILVGQQQSAPFPGQQPPPNPIFAQSNQGGHGRRKRQVPVADLAQQEELMWQYIVDECEALYQDVFWSKLYELSKRTPHVQAVIDPATLPAPRHKRGVISSALGTVAEVVTAACVSNLLSTAFSLLYPGSDHNKIIDIAEQTEFLTKKAREFEQNLNITHAIESGIIEQMKSFSQTQRDLKRQIHSLSHLMPRITWASSFIQSRITAMATDLQLVVDEYSQGRVACSELSDLLRFPLLKNVDRFDTNFEKITLINDNIFYLEFTTRNKAEGTHIFKISSFRYWENLTDVPTLMEYQQTYRYVVYNETARCIKGIHKPTTRAVRVHCRQENYTQDALKEWNVIARDRNIENYKHTCQMKETWAYTYVYCFPFNITTN